MPTANVHRVPQQSVVVLRKGEKVYPPIGKPFDFTQEEVDMIEASNPDALSSHVLVDLAAEPASSPDL